MFSIHIPDDWDLPDHRLTDEETWVNRREVLRALGFGALAAPLLGAQGPRVQEPRPASRPARPKLRKGYPAPLDPEFADPGRKLTPERLATRYNNFYEFTTDKRRVHELTGKFVIDPWTVEIGGLCKKAGKYSVADLEQLVPLEERRYRFRCVEAWSMTVPWTGLPLGAVMKKLEVEDAARYVRFVSANRPAEMPGIAGMPGYPWPYHECLTLAEARNVLTLLGTGIYGKPLPKQNGAPVRLVVPWKYGLKNIKSIVAIEFTAEKHGTFWNEIAPDEYSWHSNVDPRVPHPRWSQATERRIDDGSRIPTRPYNGYGSYVAKLYR